MCGLSGWNRIKKQGVQTVVGEGTKVKAQSKLADTVNRQRPENVFVPLRQSIDT